MASKILGATRTSFGKKRNIFCKRILADATAYEITQINNAISSNPAYIQLQSLEALKSISKDPASKVYFLDGSSPSPLPLMHLGDTQR